MFEKRGKRRWTACPLGYALVFGMTSLLIVEGELNDARGAWFSFPMIGRKVKDDPFPKSPPGISTTIRNLMQEAKSLEEQGNLDRAIVLADCAARLSEKSPGTSNSPDDISPAATARFARQLRQKKVELMTKRSEKTREPEPSITTHRASSDQKSNIVQSTSAQPEKDAGVTRIGRHSNQQNTIDSAIGVSTVNATESLHPLKVLVDTSDDTSTSNQASETVSVLVSEITAASSASSDQPVTHAVEQLDENPKGIEFNSEPQLEPVAKEPAILNCTADDEFEGVHPRVTPLPFIEPKDSLSRRQSTSMRIKLRPRYVENLQADSNPLPSTTDEPSILIEGPIIHPRQNPPLPQGIGAPRPLQDATEVNYIQPALVIASKELDTVTEAGMSHEIVSDVDPEDTSRAFAVAFSEADLADDSNDVAEAIPETELQTEMQTEEEKVEANFPTQNVLELKRRLDSVTALNPGGILLPVSVELLSDSFNNSNDLATDEELRQEILKLRQRGKSILESPTADTTSPSIEAGFDPIDSRSLRASPSRNSVVGKTSLIKWRPAKDETASVTTANRSMTKTAEFPNELRQSLPSPILPPSSATPGSAEQPWFSLPSVRIGQSDNTNSQPLVVSTQPRHELRGSLLDNATAPSIDGSSGSISGASKKDGIEAGTSNPAPPPPAGFSVKQASFGSPDEPIRRHCRSRRDLDSTSLAKQEEMGGLASIRATASTPNLAEIDDAEDPSEADQKIGLKDATQPQSTDGFVDRLAQFLGLPSSTVSSLLGTSVIMMIAAGLWIVRSTVRVKNL